MNILIEYGIYKASKIDHFAIAFNFIGFGAISRMLIYHNSISKNISKSTIAF